MDTVETSAADGVIKMNVSQTPLGSCNVCLPLFNGHCEILICYSSSKYIRCPDTQNRLAKLYTCNWFVKILIFIFFIPFLAASNIHLKTTNK